MGREEFKARYRGTKGELELCEKDLVFVPKHESAGRVTIKYEDMTKIATKGIIGTFFSIIFFPFVILFFIMCIFSHTSANTGTSPNTKVIVKTKSSGTHVFYVTRGRGDLLRQLRGKVRA